LADHQRPLGIHPLKPFHFAVQDAAHITRQAKSNLAFALKILPAKKRRDMQVFYAFCRIADDLADAPGLDPQARAAGFQSWLDGLNHGFASPTPLQSQLVELRDRLQIPNDWLTDILLGCQSDLAPQRFETWEELDLYIRRVACAVGWVSVRVFGCQSPAAHSYATALARALQLTNILRDIREDLENGGRIYLPIEDLERFGYHEDDLHNRVADGRFLMLMKFEADRAMEFFDRAERLLPQSDRKALRPAKIMAAIYRHLLTKMSQDGFRVFKKRYRVSSIRKSVLLAKHLIAG